jgi:hypothetical protein
MRMTDDLSRALGDMARTVLSVVPTAVLFMTILAVGYVAGRLVRTVVSRVLHRVGFDRAVDRGGVGRVLGGDVDAADLCATIAFYAVLLAALQLGFGVWGPNPVSDLLTDLVAWLPNAFVAIVIVVVAAAISRALRDLLGGALGGVPHGRVLARVASLLVLGVGVVAAMDQARIATAVTRPVMVAVLATVAGVLVVGVGGGLVLPLRQRSTAWLARAGTEARTVREHARVYAERRAAEAEAARRAAERAAAERAAAERAAAERAAAERAAAERAAAERAAAERAEAERAAAEVAHEAADEQARAERLAADGAAAEQARRSALGALPPEETQVIPPPEETQVIPPPGGWHQLPHVDRSVEDDAWHVEPGFGRPVDDELHIVPGFDRPVDEDGWHIVPGFDRFDDDVERTQVLPPSRPADETPGGTRDVRSGDSETPARRPRPRRRPWT